VIRQGIDDRHRALAALSQRIARYLSVGGAVSGVTDRIRLVRRFKLKLLLGELEELLGIFPAELASADGRDQEPMPLGDGSPEGKAWDRLVSGTKSLPALAAPATKAVGEPATTRAGSEAIRIADAR
jgi:hypothetical protein